MLSILGKSFMTQKGRRRRKKSINDTQKRVKMCNHMGKEKKKKKLPKGKKCVLSRVVKRCNRIQSQY